MLSSTYIKAVGHSIGYSRQLNNSVWQKNKGYEAKQTQRQIETAIRKQKDLSIIAGAAGDKDLQLQAQEKLNLLANKYAKFSKAADLPTRVERLRVEGFKSVKIPQKPLTNAEKRDIIKEIREIKGFKSAHIHIPAEKINIDELKFDSKHINERGHNVTEKMAHEYIKNAVISVTKRNGMTKNYYGYEGAVYINPIEKMIKTAF